jgi:16S rRNA (cytidine1402-2'-O)-methyltransferase
LRAVDVIACEDTRHTIKLLNHFGIEKSLTSYHEFNEEKKAIHLADRLAGGENVALVSDAGTPGISDPGYRLVRACRQRNIPVIAVAGPSALAHAGFL